MREVAELLEALRAAGLVRRWALFGAVAQMRYTEAVVTVDADVLIDVPDGERLDLLGPVYAFCAARGYVAEGGALRVGVWPVQLIPTYSALSEEALANAEEAELDGVRVFVVGADYLAALALGVGRAKDLARILALLESGSVTLERIGTLVARHGLAPTWERFRSRFDV